jgi:magnesium chelatase family protein
MDRIDLFTTTNSFVSTDAKHIPIDLNTLACQVEKATHMQRERYKKSPLTSNGDLQSKDMLGYCPLTPQARKLLEKYTEAFQLSARRYVILHRVARTIADLDNKETIDENHIAETIQYCVREK